MNSPAGRAGESARRLKSAPAPAGERGPRAPPAAGTAGESGRGAPGPRIRVWGPIRWGPGPRPVWGRALAPTRRRPAAAVSTSGRVGGDPRPPPPQRGEGGGAFGPRSPHGQPARAFPAPSSTRKAGRGRGPKGRLDEGTAPSWHTFLAPPRGRALWPSKRSLRQAQTSPTPGAHVPYARRTRPLRQAHASPTPSRPLRHRAGGKAGPGAGRRRPAGSSQIATRNGSQSPPHNLQATAELRVSRLHASEGTVRPPQCCI